MLVLGPLCMCLLTGTYAISCGLAINAQLATLYSIALLANFLNAFEAASNAMASDGSESDEVRRSIAMTMVNICKTGGVLGGFIGGYFVLNADLEDYTIVWVVISGIFLSFTILAMVVIRESFTVKADIDPSEVRDSSQNISVASNQCFKVFGDSFEAMRLVWEEPFLRFFILVGTVVSYVSIYGAIAICGAWGISICKYNQAIASLMGVVQPAFIIIGSLSSAALVRTLGPYFAWVIGLLLTASGLVVTGAGAFLPEQAPMLWWAGFGGMMGFGMGVTGPCGNGFMSPRVADDDQGKLFSMVYLFAAFGNVIGTYFFSNYLLKNDSQSDTSWQLACAWFIAAAMQIFVLAVFVVIYIRYIVSKRHAQSRAPPLVDRPDAAEGLPGNEA